MCFPWKGSRKPLFDLILKVVFELKTTTSTLSSLLVLLCTSDTHTLSLHMRSLPFFKQFRPLWFPSLIQVQMHSRPPTFTPLASVHLCIDIRAPRSFFLCLTRLLFSKNFPCLYCILSLSLFFPLDSVAYPYNVLFNLDTVGVFSPCRNLYQI